MISSIKQQKVECYLKKTVFYKVIKSYEVE